MEKYEPSLVILTVLSRMLVGVTLALTLRVLQGKPESKRLYWLASGLVLMAASVAAILHLTRPDRACDALINLQHTWLDRKILGATLYGAAVGVTLLAKGHRAPAALASVLGITLMAVQEVTHAALVIVAIANSLTMLLFSITVWAMGCAAIPLLNLIPTVVALCQGIAVCMAAVIVAPIIWLSGGTVMQMTAHAWLTSPFYLASLMCLAVAFALSRQGEHHVKVLFTLLFVGVFLNRLTFSGDTTSSIVNAGHLY